VMAGGDMAGGDLAAHEVAILPFGRKVDRRWRTLLTALDLAQIERRAEMPGGLADQDQRVAVPLQREIDRLAGVGDQPDPADHRGRQYRAAAGLVVERHIA